MSEKAVNQNVYKEIINLGLPSCMEALFTTFASVIDSKMVSAMGITAISAISVTNQPRLFVYSVFFALNTVTASLTARYAGSKDRDKANQLFSGVLKIVIILSILLSILTILLARQIMIVFSHQPDTLQDSVLYFRIVMGGMIFNLLFMAVNAALRGCGKTRLTFITSVLSAAVNILFDYLLIEGHFGFPALGIKGAAVATVVGNFAAFLLSLWWAMKKDLFVNIPYCISRHYKLDLSELKEMTEMTKSTFTDNFVMRLSLLIISGIVARIGSFQMAVYSVAMQLMNVNAALGGGLQTSAVTLIGSSYGENNAEKACTYKKAHIRLALGTSIFLGLLIICFGRSFFGMYSSDPEFLSLGTISCYMIGVISIVQTLKFAYSGCLQGIGAMKDVMKASIVSFTVVNLGMLAVLILVFKTGLIGVWCASFASQSVQALMLRYYMSSYEILGGKPKA